MKQLSIVLPFYNPQQGWEQNVYNTYLALKNQLGFEPEIIVVNDGSTNQQEKEIDFLNQKIVDFKALSYAANLGKGAALRFGIKDATSERIIFTDIDFPYTTESFLKVWNQLKTNDIVLGVKDKTYYQHLSKERVWISKFLRKMIGIFFRMPITDTQCGLKGFNQKGKDVFLNTTIDRYLCDLEFVYKSYRIKPELHIIGQEVTLRNEVEFRKMNLKILFSEFFNFIKILKN